MRGENQGTEGFDRRQVMAGVSGLALGSATPPGHARAPQAELPAWRRYEAAVEETRRLIYSQAWARDPAVRAEADYFLQQLQAVAYNVIVGPRPDYPTLYVHTIFEPVVYSWSNYSVDFKYRECFLDGGRTYRLWGKRNTPAFIDFQSMNHFFSGPNARKVGNYLIDDFALQPDGRFEIVVSATPHPGNWIKLDGASDRNLLLIRECFTDWSGQQPAELHIDPADGKPARPIVLSEAEYGDRLADAARFLRFASWDWAIELTRRLFKTVGPNRIFDKSFDKDQGGGNDPFAVYPTAIYDLKPDEALLVEWETPQAKYWSVQLADLWFQVRDYTYHQSSLNNHQAVMSGDGRFWAIVARRDPGAANWLDTVDSDIGIMIFRAYQFQGEVRLPVLRKIGFDQVRAELPPDTAWVSADQRAALVKRRERGARARFGY